MINMVEAGCQAAGALLLTRPCWTGVARPGVLGAVPGTARRCSPASGTRCSSVPAHFGSALDMGSLSQVRTGVSRCPQFLVQNNTRRTPVAPPPVCVCARARTWGPLPPAPCLLPPASCLLPPASCLLPSGSHRLRGSVGRGRAPQAQKKIWSSPQRGGFFWRMGGAPQGPVWGP